MKHETVLNAMILAEDRICNNSVFSERWTRASHKFHRFRAWLIRHDERQRMEIERLRDRLIEYQHEERLANLIKGKEDDRLQDRV